MSGARLAYLALVTSLLAVGGCPQLMSDYAVGGGGSDAGLKDAEQPPSDAHAGDGASGGDAGPAADASDAQSTADTSGPDSGADEGASDAGIDQGGPIDAAGDGFTCTPLGVVEVDLTCEQTDASFAPFPVPTDTLLWNPSNGQCSGIATPAQCTCAETYNCACLHAVDVCANGQGVPWSGCDTQTTDAGIVVPRVTCQ